jgi:hypothetical protein
MNRFRQFLPLLFLLVLPVVIAALPKQVDPEESAIRTTIEHYFRGDIERDVEQLKIAFHPTAVLQTSDESGTLKVLTQRDWHESIRRTPDRERPTASILQLDRAGVAALAKTELVFPHGRYTDYLSLLKIDGRWKIVHKTYHWQAK